MGLADGVVVGVNVGVGLGVGVSKAEGVGVGVLVGIGVVHGSSTRLPLGLFRVRSTRWPSCVHLFSLGDQDFAQVSLGQVRSYYPGHTNKTLAT